MAQVGDDCYFFYYSSCSKGASCPFRHVDAARGSEVMCSHWAAGSCTRPGCRYRHFEIKVDRSNIPCYWESQPSGCTKPHCVFKHFKQQHDDTPPDILSTSVIKNPTFNAGVNAETILQRTSAQSEVDRASPRIEPVVVNPFEDDSDADSTAGTPQKKMIVKQIAAASKPPVGTTLLTRKHVASSTGIAKRKISMLDNQEDTRGAKVSVSDSVLYEETPTRRNVVLDDDSSSGPTKSFQELVKKSKSSLGLAGGSVSDVKPVKMSIKRRLGLTEHDQQPAVKVSVRDRLGGSGDGRGSGDSLDRSPNKGGVKSRLGLTSSSSLAAKSLAGLEDLKGQLTKQLDLEAESSTEEDGTEDIKIKSLAEIRAEKARKAALQSKESEGNEEKRRWRKTSKPPTTSDKVKHKRKIITYTELFDEDKKAVESQSIQKVETKKEVEAPAKSDRVKRKPVAPKGERAIYQPPARKTTEELKPKPIAARIGAVSSPEKGEDKQDTKAKSPGDVKVKTFSEIMAEKRKKQQELKAKQESENIQTTSKVKARITPIVFDVEKTEDKPSEKQVAAVTGHKKTVPVAPLRVKSDPLKENISVEAITESEKSGGERLLETHVLSDNNVCEKMKSIERPTARDEGLARQNSGGKITEDTAVISPNKRRTSSQGSDLPSKKKSRQSLNLTEDDDDFFFGTDLDDMDDGGKIDEGDLLQDIDELLA